MRTLTYRIPAITHQKSFTFSWGNRFKFCSWRNTVPTSLNLTFFQRIAFCIERMQRHEVKIQRPPIFRKDLVTRIGDGKVCLTHTRFNIILTKLPT